MCSHISSVYLLAAIVSFVRCQSFPNEASLPGCGETCLDEIITGGISFGCSDGSVGCFCAAANFQKGVYDCATTNCAADLLPDVTSYLAGVCATAVASSASLTTPAPVSFGTSLVISTATSQAVYASAVPTTTYSVSASTISPDLDPVSTSTTIAIIPSSIISSTATSSTSVANNLATISSAPTSASHIATGTVSPNANNSNSTSSTSTAKLSAPTLSVGAKAGIGIGAAVGVVAVIALIVTCVITRKHKHRRAQSDSQSFKISKPMPGSGRFCADVDNGQGFEPSSELEMKSRRYEDMVPRHVPRNMV